MLPAKLYSQGLAGGPFFSVYEGALSIDLSSNRTLAFAVTAKHVFADNTTLSTTRTLHFRANSQNAVSIPLVAFSSITELPIGATFRNDQGETVTITAALLAEPVTISVAGELTAESKGSRVAATVEALSSELTAVTWYQLRSTDAVRGLAQQIVLSNADPSPTGAAPVPGSSGQASRGDHVHQVGLSLLTPKAPGEAAPGSSDLPGPWDHVHPVDPDTAGNTTKIDDLANELETVSDAIPDPSTATPKAESGGGAAGSSADYSRGDHVHPASGGGGNATPLSDATPLVDGTAAAGSAGAASRGDHVHPTFPLSVFGAVGASGTCAKANATRDGFRYGDCGSPRVLANANPQPDGTAAPGASLQASRGDHVHPANVGTRVPPHASFITGAAGSSAVAAREDHAHALLGSAIAPKALGTAAVGTSVAPARSDHVHPAPAAEVPAPSAAAKGDIPRVKSDGSDYELVDPHVAVLSGLPAITGQGGKVLGVNTAGTALEFVTVGSGGGTAGGFEELESVAITNNTSATYSDATCAKVGIGDTIGLFFDKSGHPDIYGVGLIVRTGGTQYFAGAESNPQKVVVWRFNARASGCQVELASPSTGNARLYKLALGGGGGSSGPSVPSPSGAGNYLRVDSAGNAYELGGLPFSDVLPQASTGTTGFAGVLKGISRADHRHKRDADTTANTTRSAANATKIAANETAIAGKASVGTFTPLVDGEAAAGSSQHASREDHVHPLPPFQSGFVEMLNGQLSLTNNNVDFEVDNAALHNFLKAADAPKLMYFILRYTAGSVNYAYLLTCPGADTPLGNAESRTFFCLGWRERTGQAITGQIDVAPSAYRIKISNIDARGNSSVNYRLWGQR